MPRQNTSPADYPQAVLQQIEQLAQNIVIARKRRGETQAQWAKKLGVSQPTMARIERGDPSVAMASYVMCLWLINQAEGLADLISPLNDHAALEREVTKVRAKRKPATPGRSVKAKVQSPRVRESDTSATGVSHNAPKALLGMRMPASAVYAHAPAAKAIATFQDSPAVKALAELQNSPAIKAVKAVNQNAAGLAALINKQRPKSK